MLDLAPLVHVFGHSHIKVDTKLPFDGAPLEATAAAGADAPAPSWRPPHGLHRAAKTRFVQASLGYPSERGHRPPSLSRMALLWPAPYLA